MEGEGEGGGEIIPPLLPLPPDFTLALDTNNITDLARLERPIGCGL